MDQRTITCSTFEKRATTNSRFVFQDQDTFGKDKKEPLKSTTSP